ncbi:MAG: 23S rRNA (adenine(2503)-C(2))-methyltransferase RlmN [Phycisphaerales bacterium JB040]
MPDHTFQPAHTAPAPSGAAPHPLGMTHEAYLGACKAVGIGSGKANARYTAFYRDGRDETGLDSPIPPVVRTHEEEVEEGTVTKFCQRVPPPRVPEQGDRPSAREDDPRTRHLDIESVIIPMEGQTGRKTTTLCVSSQVGCAMGCDFCETAQMGLVRNLTPAEIVAQWWAATHERGATIDNIVFMGMGEPLDNLDNVLAAIACLTDRYGPNVAMSGITISTVGRVDGLRRLVEVVKEPGWKRLGIALSVNAPNDAVRNRIMPLNRKWGMAELQRVMLDFAATRAKGRKMMFEYVLIPGVNDAPEHADQIAAWMKPFAKQGGKSHLGLLNVIPYNPRRNSPWPAPDEGDVERFVKRVGSHGIFVKRRRTKGRSQMAACGQLGTAEIRKRKYVGVTTGGAPPTSDPGEPA